VTIATASGIRWPEYIACALLHAHRADVVAYARRNELVCADCRIPLVRARTWPGRLLEWSITVALALFIAGPIALAAWWWR
jgi:hypothetical protein